MIIMLKLKSPNPKRRRRGEAELSSPSLMEFIIQYCKRHEEEEAQRRNCSYWSQLPPDLTNSVLERLSLRDLQRAKSVCSAWLAASRNCAPKSQVPWLILFPEDNRCKLFNPEEKDKMYTSRDLGVGFAESVCVATHGCWLLMRNPLSNLYIVNLLTGERIDLPPVESQLTVGLQQINSPRLWVDEETKDYLVISSFGVYKYAFVCKKGDYLWRQIPDSSPCSDLVYTHRKLYVYRNGVIQISDFSGELPGKTHAYAVSFSLNMYHFLPSTSPCFTVRKTNIVVTVSGDVLMAASAMGSCKTWSFRIYKMNSAMDNWMMISSLGDEAMLLDLGITVRAKDIEGIKKNSIYFSASGQHGNDVFIFDIKTHKIERPHQPVCWSLRYSRARWFFPAFSLK